MTTTDPRPQDRDSPLVAGIVLAAGRSTRFRGLKQLAQLHGKPLVQHVVDNAAAAGLEEIVVVLGHRADDVRAALDLPPVARTVSNEEAESGQSTSLRLGIEALDESVGAAIVLLGDQPTIAPPTIRTVIDAYTGSGALVVRARYGGLPGHPVVLGRETWPEVTEITGDRGARDVLAAHPEWIRHVDFPGSPPSDVDTAGHLIALHGSR